MVSRRLGLGALAGVLYAPKAGKETREDIANRAADAKERAAVLAAQGKEKAAALAEQGTAAGEANMSIADGSTTTAGGHSGRSMSRRARDWWRSTRRRCRRPSMRARKPTRAPLTIRITLSLRLQQGARSTAVVGRAL